MKEEIEKFEDSDLIEKPSEIEKQERHVTKLMQTLVDDMESLKEQKEELKTLLETQAQAYKIICESNGTSYTNLLEYLKSLKAEYIDEFKNNKAEQNQNSRVEYILFGKDTPFSSKLLLGLITLILFSFLLFEYGTPLLIEKSELKNQRDNYKLYYDYSLLKAFEDSDKNPEKIISIFSSLKARDTVMIKYIDSMTLVLQKRLRKKELESELKTLD
ncbi:hypothetical protein ACNI3T_14575 [Christiangramia sp. ASW11-125]|uniref:hypothetical protein n=1 Tax=Christiangramia TaxID=292691 RepID=UPI0004279528|nr:hypothetical protein [Christiangramia portivictoriae]